MKRLILLTVFILQLGFCLAQTPDKAIQGIWLGSLKVQQGISLRIVLNISEKDGSLITTMDSPDQGVKGIPTESTTFSGNELLVKIPAMRVQYKGILEDSVTIKGTFIQGEMQLPLDLSKQVELKEDSAAVQDPNAGKYTSTDIKFRNEKAGITLAGTVTYPKDKTNCPVAILLTGSGAQDRDETIFAQKPFLRLADRLSANGIAVLRFDDRGFAQSEGDLWSATSYDFVTDALAAYEYMKTYPGINSRKIGFIGHSEGAGLATMAAVENKDIAFVVMLAGTTLPGDSLLCLQAAAINRAAGMGEDAIKSDYKMRSGIYEIIKKESDNTKASEQITTYVNGLPDFPAEQKKVLIEAFMKAGLNPWMRAFLGYDPAPYLAKLTCPTVAFFGSKDLQIPAKENIGGLMNVVYKNKKNNFSIVTINGVNHLFQNAKTGLVDEYSNKTEVVMNDETLDKLQDWLNNYLLK